MGIRFRCHHCGHELHVKDFQGGKRGRCPKCQGRFRIPTEDAELSLDLDDSGPSSASSTTEQSAGPAATTEATSEVDTSQATTDSEQAPKEAASAASTPQKGPAEKTATDTAATASPSEGQPPDSGQQPAPPASQNLTATVPNAIQEAPGATWYVRPPSGGQYGPAKGDTLQMWLRESRISRDSLVWREGWPEWIVAAQAFEDYFGPTTQSVAEQGQEASTNQSPGGITASAASQTSASAGQPSLGDRNRSARKINRRRRYMISLVVLFVLAITLISILVVVLINQQ